MRGKRLAIVLVLAAGGVLVGLLATGVLSRSTGGTGKAIPTTAPVISTTTAQPQPGDGATAFSPDDWGTYGGTYDQNRHSALTLITKQNVNELGRVATIDFRRIDPTVPKGQQSFPVVVNGVIYVTTANGFVFAVDGGSGKVLWKWKPSNTGVFANYGVNANRGVAYCDGKVFLLTLDMHIVSLDASTGKLVKQVAISDSCPGSGFAVQLLRDAGADLLRQHADHRRFRIGLRRARLHDGVHGRTSRPRGRARTGSSRPTARAGAVSASTSGAERTGTRARSTRRPTRSTSRRRTRRRSSTPR